MKDVSKPEDASDMGTALSGPVRAESSEPGVPKPVSVVAPGEKEDAESLLCGETMAELSSNESSGNSFNDRDAERRVQELLPQKQVDPAMSNGEAVTPAAEEGAPHETAGEIGRSRAVEQAEQQRDEIEVRPEKKFAERQRVYARDEVTGLLYEAVVRRIMWGPKSRQLNVHLVQDPDQVIIPGEDDDDEDPEWCWHYFVHYQGWNTRWDRWVEESCLFEVSEGTKTLAKRLAAELKEMKKQGKVGRGARDSDVIAVRRRMLQLEEERREEERKEELRKQGIFVEEEKEGEEDEAKLDPEEEKAYEVFSSEMSPKVIEDNAGATPERISKLLLGKWRELGEDEREKYKLKCKESAAEDPAEPTGKKPGRRRKRKLMRKAELEKERKLRQRDLSGKRKQAEAEKVMIPFALKKILVDEWEIVSQCQMVPIIPSKIPVMVVLHRYLQSKLDVIRQKHRNDDSNDQKNDKGSTDDNQNNGEESTNVIVAKPGRDQNGKAADQGKDADKQGGESIRNQEETSMCEQGKEWVDMVDGIMQYFDEALPVRLLYWQELGQHRALMKSKDSELASKRMCEVYGCECLLRLFINFPSLLEDSDIPEAQKRLIYAKIGDLIRFLQKHQDEFFIQRYRKPEKNEITVQKQVRNKQPKANKRDEAGPSTPKTCGQKAKTKIQTSKTAVGTERAPSVKDSAGAKSAKRRRRS